jgi:hypothetical protein
MIILQANNTTSPNQPLTGLFNIETQAMKTHGFICGRQKFIG